MKFPRLLTFAILFLLLGVASASTQPINEQSPAAERTVERESAPAATVTQSPSAPSDAPTAPSPSVQQPGVIERLLEPILGAETVKRFRGTAPAGQDAPQQGEGPRPAQEVQSEPRPAGPLPSTQEPALDQPTPAQAAGPPPPQLAPISPSPVVAESRLVTRPEAEEMLRRYGSVPGGLVLEDTAVGLGSVKTARYEPARNAFILDERVVYVARISARSAAALARALAEDDRVGVSLGEEAEIVYGRLPKSSELALDLKLADNFLGDIILPPREWTLGYRFANGFEPVQDLGSGTAAVFFRLRDFQFALDGDKLDLAQARFDVRIVPILDKKAPDGGYLPDFQAITAGVGFEPYQIGAGHVADNIEYYLNERIVERVLAYGEVAALFRGLKAAGVDLRELAHTVRMSDASSASRPPARNLVEGWLAYLREIQTDQRYPNWSGPPYDLHVSRDAAHKPASSTGR